MKNYTDIFLLFINGLSAIVCSFKIIFMNGYFMSINYNNLTMYVYMRFYLIQ